MPENIPDKDDVSRHLFEPSMGSLDADLRWDNVFMFKTQHGCCESVVWRKYKSQIAEVHDLGCKKQRDDRAAGKNCTYFGALTGNVGEVRSLRSAKGARLMVVHAPEEGTHHAHLTFEGDPPRTCKVELKIALRRSFGARSSHACVDEAV